jgi:hypothetical protein
MKTNQTITGSSKFSSFSGGLLSPHGLLIRSFTLFFSCLLASHSVTAQSCFEERTNLTNWGDGTLGRFVHTCDVDGDGRSDFIFAYYNSWADEKGVEVRMIMPRENGSFQTRIFHTNWGDGVLSKFIGVGDVDADGYKDLFFVFYNNWSGKKGVEIRIILPRADGTFQTRNHQTDWGDGTLGKYIGLGDINKDGNTDVLFAYYNSWSQKKGVELRMILPHADGTFQTLAYHTDWGDGCVSRYVSTGDIDRDGRTDVVFAFYNSWASEKGVEVRVIIPGENGTFQTRSFHTNWGTGVLAKFIGLGDGDGDGRKDFLFAYHNSWDSEKGVEVRMILPRENGTFQTRIHRTDWGDGVVGNYTGIGDADGDGKTDFLFVFYNSWASEKGTEVRMILPREDGKFQTRIYPTGWGDGTLTKFVGTGDVDGDNKTDILLAFYNSWSTDKGAEVRAIMFRDDGTFSDRIYQTNWGDGVLAKLIAVGDGNADKKSDFLFAFYNSWTSTAGVDVRMLISHDDNSFCCNPALVSSLAVPLHPQETGMWCWAASGQMIMDYLEHNISQCVQANNRFGRSDCCTIDLCPVPTVPNCDQPQGHPCACGGWPEFDKYGFTFKRTHNAALTWDQVRNQLSNEKFCKKTPFAFSWGWAGGGGHMMVAKGFLTLNGVNYVIIHDPWSPCVGDERIITYSRFSSNPGHYTHWDDFYDIKYTGGK